MEPVVQSAAPIKSSAYPANESESTSVRILHTLGAFGEWVEHKLGLSPFQKQMDSAKQHFEAARTGLLKICMDENLPAETALLKTLKPNSDNALGQLREIYETLSPRWPQFGEIMNLPEYGPHIDQFESDMEGAWKRLQVEGCELLRRVDITKDRFFAKHRYAEATPVIHAGERLRETLADLDHLGEKPSGGRPAGKVLRYNQLLEVARIHRSVKKSVTTMLHRHSPAKMKEVNTPEGLSKELATLQRLRSRNNPLVDQEPLHSNIAKVNDLFIQQTGSLVPSEEFRHRFAEKRAALQTDHQLGQLVDRTIGDWLLAVQREMSAKVASPLAELQELAKNHPDSDVKAAAQAILDKWNARDTWVDDQLRSEQHAVSDADLANVAKEIERLVKDHASLKKSLRHYDPLSQAEQRLSAKATLGEVHPYQDAVALTAKTDAVSHNKEVQSLRNFIKFQLDHLAKRKGVLQAELDFFMNAPGVTDDRRTLKTREIQAVEAAERTLRAIELADNKAHETVASAIKLAKGKPESKGFVPQAEVQGQRLDVVRKTRTEAARSLAADRKNLQRIRNEVGALLIRVDDHYGRTEVNQAHLRKINHSKEQLLKRIGTACHAYEEKAAKLESAGSIAQAQALRLEAFTLRREVTDLFAREGLPMGDIANGSTIDSNLDRALEKAKKAIPSLLEKHKKQAAEILARPNDLPSQWSQMLLMREAIGKVRNSLLNEAKALAVAQGGLSSDGMPLANLIEQVKVGDPSVSFARCNRVILDADGNVPDLVRQHMAGPLFNANFLDLHAVAFDQALVKLNDRFRSQIEDALKRHDADLSRRRAELRSPGIRDTQWVHAARCGELLTEVAALKRVVDKFFAAAANPDRLADPKVMRSHYLDVKKLIDRHRKEVAGMSDLTPKEQMEHVNYSKLERRDQLLIVNAVAGTTPKYEEASLLIGSLRAAKGELRGILPKLKGVQGAEEAIRVFAEESFVGREQRALADQVTPEYFDKLSKTGKRLVIQQLAETVNEYNVNIEHARKLATNQLRHARELVMKIQGLRRISQALYRRLSTEEDKIGLLASTTLSKGERAMLNGWNDAAFLKLPVGEQKIVVARLERMHASFTAGVEKAREKASIDPQIAER